MAQIIIQIPDGQINKLKAAIEEQYIDNPDEAPNLSTHELVMEFFKNKIKDDIKVYVRQHEYKKAKRNVLTTISLVDIEVED